MPFLDGVRPPKKKKKDIKYKPVKQLAEKIYKHKKNTLAQEEKYRLVWMAAAVITLIIAIGWGWLVFNGKLNKSANDGNKWQTVSDSVEELWDIFKTDILKLEKALNQEKNITDEQKIEELEKRVFPQFEDPQKQ